MLAFRRNDNNSMVVKFANNGKKPARKPKKLKNFFKSQKIG